MDQLRRSLLKAAGAAAVVVPYASIAGAAGSSLGTETELGDIAAQAVGMGASPGIQVAVWREGQPVASVARGFSNLETKTEVTPSSIFRAGSLTKQITAALAAKLEEQGRLSLNDSVAEHLSFFGRGAAPSILELIHHTAGLREEGTSFISLEAVSQIELAQRIARQSQVYDFNPGAAWLYSNANYIVLGAVIEAATGTALSEVADRLIFTPLGLSNTSFDTSSAVVPNRASGYSASASHPGTFLNADFIPIEQTGGAGAVRSTADDLCRWHQALISSRLLSEKSLGHFFAPSRMRDGRPIVEGRFNPADSAMGETSYGYGVYLDHSAKSGGLIAQHNGFVSGFSAYLASHVSSQLTVACLCNGDPGPNLPFRALRRAVFRDFL